MNTAPAGSMSKSDVEDAAMFLLHLRLQRDQVAGLPHELAPKTLADAYAIQDATHHFAGWPLGMLKVGCTSELARQFLGIPHPIGGRVPADAIFDSGSVVPRSFFAAAPMLECEIAVRIGADGDVDAVAPAIELIDSRFRDSGRVAGPSIVADNSAACGAVLGTPVPIAQADDLSAIAMTLRNDDTDLVAGDAGALLGGPQFSVDWIIEHESGRGRSIEPGAWIITGTCTGLTPTTWGMTYTADFGSLGEVAFTLDA